MKRFFILLVFFASITNAQADDQPERYQLGDGGIESHEGRSYAYLFVETVNEFGYSLSREYTHKVTSCLTYCPQGAILKVDISDVESRKSAEDRTSYEAQLPTVGSDSLVLSQNVFTTPGVYAVYVEGNYLGAVRVDQKNLVILERVALADERQN